MDSKAKNILFKTYWSAKGWKDFAARHTTQEDFEYARSKGLMFDPLCISKQDLVNELRRLIESVPRIKVTNAFLCSLTNKRLDWRSALGSYANAQLLLESEDIDDFYYGFGHNIDLNVLNFERIKWGGVRHYNGIYNLVDLRSLEKENVPLPTADDIAVLKAIFKVIDNSAFGDTPGKLCDRLKDILRFSKSDSRILIEILACAGILRPLRYDRKVPKKNDWTFVLHWRGEDKYDKANAAKYFGAYGVI